MKEYREERGLKGFLWKIRRDGCAQVGFSERDRKMSLKDLSTICILKRCMYSDTYFNRILAVDPRGHISHHKKSQMTISPLTIL